MTQKNYYTLEAEEQDPYTGVTTYKTELIFSKLSAAHKRLEDLIKIYKRYKDTYNNLTVYSNIDTTTIEYNLQNQKHHETYKIIQKRFEDYKY